MKPPAPPKKGSAMTSVIMAVLYSRFAKNIFLLYLSPEVLYNICKRFTESLPVCIFYFC